MAITKPDEHEIDRTGKRLLREALESLRWVVNDVQEDYGIDCNIQVFDGNNPTGTWFHVQLKSSSSSDYDAKHDFISQKISINHARHYSMEMRDPVLIIHADVTSKAIYWYAPQLDRHMIELINKTESQSVTVRIPTSQLLPRSAPKLLTSLDNIYLALANRELTSSSASSFAESLVHLPDQEASYRAFQEKSDILKLQRARDLFEQGKSAEARSRVEVVLADPDSTVEIKFWAELQLEVIDYKEAVHSGKPHNALPKVLLTHARALQKLTASGPKHLKFFSLIARHSAELEQLVYENSDLLMLLHQHLSRGGDPMMVLSLYAKRAALTRRIVTKFNRCVRLAHYAANYPDRWALGRALAAIVNAMGKYFVTLRSEKNLAAERAFAQSALQICKLAAWIGNETADPTAVLMAIMSALGTVNTAESDAYRWADQIARSLNDPAIRADAIRRIERAMKRWKGEPVEGDYVGDTIWQIIENMAAGLGIDISDANEPLVRLLKIAAKDNTPERVLAKCEHLIVGQGAMGPTARRIQALFNITTAGSKVVHCTLHDCHVEGKELDTAYGAFKLKHCDSCPDQKPRAADWRYTEQEKQAIQTRHYQFVARLAGTAYGVRNSTED